MDVHTVDSTVSNGSCAKRLLGERLIPALVRMNCSPHLVRTMYLCAKIAYRVARRGSSCLQGTPRVFQFLMHRFPQWSQVSHN